MHFRRSLNLSSTISLILYLSHQIGVIESTVEKVHVQATDLYILQNDINNITHTCNMHYNNVVAYICLSFYFIIFISKQVISKQTLHKKNILHQ